MDFQNPAVFTKGYFHLNAAYALFLCLCHGFLRHMIFSKLVCHGFLRQTIFTKASFFFSIMIFHDTWFVQSALGPILRYQVQFVISVMVFYDT